ncbi:MAG: PQQ-binding-like beta-propeller repeat protein [Candidatus Neomarinimicrobiota bacterium]
MKYRRCVIYLLFLSVFISEAFSTEPLFRFAWLSDTHVGSESAAVDLRRSVSDINSLEGIDFTIISGDVTEMDVNGNLDTAKAILDKLIKPYHIIPGNHELKWSSSGGTKFRKLWGDDEFWFEYKGFQFLGFHQGPLMRMGDGYVSPEDVRWIEKTLKKHKKSNLKTIFIMHYPLDNSVSNWFEVADLAKANNVQAILHGHGHSNRITEYEGIPGVMSRSNLRGNQEIGGFTIVNAYPDSMTFCERTPGIRTSEVWGRILLKNQKTETNDRRSCRLYSSPDSSSLNVRKIWEFDTKYTLASSPTVADGKVIIGSGDGVVRAISLKTGKEVWRFQTGDPVFSSAAVSGNITVVGSTDSSIYCLNTSTGKLNWKVRTNAPAVAVPVIFQDVVYIGSSDGIFRAIDLKTGEIKWKFSDVVGFVETQPLVHEERVIFGAWDGCLYALNSQTGKLEWKWQDGRPGVLYSPAACIPVASGDKVYIAAPDRFLSCIEAKTGKTIWRSKRFQVRENVGISEDGATVFARTIQDSVFAIEGGSPTMKIKWATSGTYGYDIDPSLPVEKDGTLFFGTKDGFVYAMDAKTGAVLWKCRIGFGLVNNVIPLSRTEVVASIMDGKIVLLKYSPN